MIEITITCDRCGMSHAYEAELTSQYVDDGDSVCILSTPREVSVLENARKHHWVIRDIFDETIVVCPNCYMDLLEETNGLDSEIYDRRMRKRDIEEHWYAPLLRHHDVKFTKFGSVWSRRDVGGEE